MANTVAGTAADTAEAEVLSAAQRLAGLYWSTPDVGRDGIRESVLALLTPLTGGDRARAGQVWGAALGTDRPVARPNLTSALGQCRKSWEAADAREAAAFRLPLASGAEVSATESAGGTVTLDMSNGGEYDDARWADARMTGAEVLTLARLLMAQPAARAAALAEDEG